MDKWCDSNAWEARCGKQSRKTYEKKEEEKTHKKAIIFIVIIDVHNYGGFNRPIKMHHIRWDEEIDGEKNTCN